MNLDFGRQVWTEDINWGIINIEFKLKAVGLELTERVRYRMKRGTRTKPWVT